VVSGLAGIATMAGAGLLRPPSMVHETGSPNAASPVATPEGDAVEIAIEATGLRFSPAVITVPARTPVRLVLTNRSRVYHDLVIPTLGRRTRRIGPDEVAELLIVAEPGEYEFHCSIPSHTQAGMGGVITAVAA
jgi:nitrite reductase (NO-forming)